jgi:phi13 family phage major tail protein
MPNTTDKARIPRTITDLGYAPITAVSADGKPTYGTVVWLPHHRAGGRSYDAQPAGSAESIWADGREVYAAEDNQGYNMTLTTVGVTDDVEEDWYGYTVDEDGAVEEYADAGAYPEFALVIIEDTTDGVGKTTVFYQCHITQRSAQQGQTSEGNGLSPQFPQHNIACRPRLDCMCVRQTIPAKTKITAIPEPSAAV